MDISLFLSIASQYKDWRNLHTVETINTLGNLLEDQVLNHKLAADIFAGFQRFSNFADQVPKYTRLGAICKRVLVFGVPDVQPPSISGVEFIPLDPNSALSRERFLAVNSGDFWAAMLATEVEEGEAISGEKRFDGGWFYNGQMVERVSLLISKVMGTFYQALPTRNYVQQNAHVAELSRRLLWQLEACERGSHRRSMQLDTMHQFSMMLVKHQPLPCILRDAVQILSTTFGATDAAIALNLQGNQFMIFSADGKLNTDKQTLHLVNGVSSQALSQGKLISVTNARQTGQPDPLISNAENLLSAPIQGRRRVHGVVTVGNNETKGWTQEDGDTVMAIANMLAVIIEQKAQVSGDVVLQLRRARQLEQMMTRLRKPMARLLSLQQKLQKEAQLLPVERDLMDEVEALYTEIATTIWPSKSLPSSHDSSLPPPPNSAGKLNSKAWTV